MDNLEKERFKEEIVFNNVNLTPQQETIAKEHYVDPKNNKALVNYNARGIGRNPDNWGQVDMYLLVDENKIIKNIGYEYKGCPTISFTASVFTEELKEVSLSDAFQSTLVELDILNAQTNCDDCIKMILVAFISAYKNYFERFNYINKEDFTLKMVETTIPYTNQSCN